VAAQICSHGQYVGKVIQEAFDVNEDHGIDKKVVFLKNVEKLNFIDTEEKYITLNRK
jgi:hypothetical protein